MKLGICERGWLRPSLSLAQTVDELVQVAREVERLGFARFWLTEHHTSGYAWSLPDALVPVIGRATSAITVGIGGVLIGSRNAYRTALDLSLCANLLGERFELGVGRATAMHHHPCLSGDELDGADARAAERYLARLTTLLRWVGFAVEGPPNIGPRDEQFQMRAFAVPLSPPWMLGSSTGSMTLAARWGLPYASIEHETVDEVVKQYRALFCPSPWLAEPRVMISIVGLLGSCDGADPRAPVGGPTPAPRRSAAEQAELQRAIGVTLARVVERCSPDEIVYTDCSHDPAQRCETYRTIAAEWIARPIAQESVS